MRLFSTAALIAAFLIIPATAVAAPQWADESPLGYDQYGVINSPLDFGAPIVDETVCADDKWDPNTESMIDVLDNNYGMAGAVFAVQRQNSSGGWDNVAQKTISRDNIDVYCESPYYEYDEGSPSDPSVGAAELVDVDLNYNMPSARETIRLSFTGGEVNANLVSNTGKLFPRFRENFTWSPGPGYPKFKKKGFVTVDVKADPRLAGTKVYMLVNPDYKKKSKPWKVVQVKTFKKKGKNAVTRLQFKHTKRYIAYACVNYAAKFPQMNTGNACPTRSATQQKLEELFPGSTGGFFG